MQAAVGAGGGGGGGGGGGAAQEPRARLVQRVVPQVVRARDVASDDAQRLREGAEFDVDLLLDVEVGCDPATAIPENALPVRVVDENHRAGLLRDVRDVPDGGDV